MRTRDGWVQAESGAQVFDEFTVRVPRRLGASLLTFVAGCGPDGPYLAPAGDRAESGDECRVRTYLTVLNCSPPFPGVRGEQEWGA